MTHDAAKAMSRIAGGISRALNLGNTRVLDIETVTQCRIFGIKTFVKA